VQLVWRLGKAAAVATALRVLTVLLGLLCLFGWLGGGAWLLWFGLEAEDEDGNRQTDRQSERRREVRAK
jgi:hypothetical protein